MLDSKAAFHTKREQAVAKVKDAIMMGRYQPGQSLKQVQLMADLDLGTRRPWQRPSPTMTCDG